MEFADKALYESTETPFIIYIKLRKIGTSSILSLKETDCNSTVQTGKTMQGMNGRPFRD